MEAAHRKPSHMPAVGQDARIMTKQIRVCRNVDELCALVRASCVHFDYVHVATAFHRLATLIKKAPQRRQSPKSCGVNQRTRQIAQQREAIELLSGRAVLLIDTFEARAVSNIWWACATMRQTPSPLLLENLLQRSFETCNDFAPQTIANTLWSMATLRIPPPTKLLRVLATRAIEMEKDFQPQVLASSLWSLATMVPLGIEVPFDMVRTLLTRSHDLAPHFEQQDLSNTMWAVAALRHRVAPSILDAHMSRLTLLAPDLTTQGLANTMWSLAIQTGLRADSTRRGQAGSAIPRELDEALKRRVRTACSQTSLKGQEVTIILWSLATLGDAVEPALLAAIQSQVVRTIPQFSPQSVSNSLWALATMRLDATQLHPHLLSHIQDRAIEIIDRFQPQALANTLWSMAHLSHEPRPDLLQAMEERIVATAGAFQPIAVANVFWSMASLKLVPSPALWAALVPRALGTMQYFKPQTVSNILWALANIHANARGVSSSGWVESGHFTASAASGRQALRLPVERRQGTDGCVASEEDEKEEEVRELREQLIKALLERSLEAAADFKPQSVASSLWALATLRVRPPPALLVALQTNAAVSSGSWSPQGITMTLWALASLGEEILPTLLRRLMAEATEQAGE